MPATAKWLCNPRTFRELLAPGYAIVCFAIYGRTAKIRYCTPVNGRGVTRKAANL